MARTQMKTLISTIRPNRRPNEGPRMAKTMKNAKGRRLLSRREVSARQDAMTYLVRVRRLLVDGES